ncbi:MAG: AAA family ATPase [Mycetocola sp.]
MNPDAHNAADEEPTFSSQPILWVRERTDAPMDRDEWPATVPPVAQLLTDGLELGQVTVLVGDNGVGKSTLVEGIAMAFGLNPEGGSTGAMHRSHASESPLSEHLEIRRGLGASKRGFFLRAETMHGFFSYLEDIGMSRGEHQRSHGESFLDVVVERSRVRGLWVLDEPESALSLPGCLALIGLLRDQVARGSQILLSTHSPVLAAFPGATLYELGEWGLRRSDYDSLELVTNWRGFLDDPGRYLRHVTATADDN